MTENDIQLIESVRFEDKISKLDAKKLQKIKDTELNVDRKLRVRHCFCSQGERDLYKIEFFIWYNENYNH